MYKNLVFDVGWVLFSYDWKGALVKAGEPEETAGILGPKLLEDPFWRELDLAIRPYNDVVEDLCKKYPDHASSIRVFLTNVAVMPIERPNVWKKVRELKDKGYKLYILSNYSEYMFTTHIKDRAFFDIFDGRMVSYMIHVNKPDERIYRALFDKYNLNPSECLFFDDRPENTEAAVKIGMDSVTVTSEAQLLEELGKL